MTLQEKLELFEIPTSNEFTIGPIFLLKEGNFINLQNTSLEKTNVGKNLKAVVHYNLEKRIGEKIVENHDGIRLNDGLLFIETPYICLSRTEPNQAQYASLKLWIEHVIDSNKKHLIIGYDDDKYALELDINSNSKSTTIINKIKELFTNN